MSWEGITKVFNVIGTGLSQIAAPLAQIYSNVIVAQANVGVADAKKSSILAEIEIAKNTVIQSEKSQEDTKKANKITNKIKNLEYITQDEYDFISELGVNIGTSYKGYIELISQPQTQNATSTSTSTQTQTQASWLPLIAVTGVGIVAYKLLKRK